jgi:hypothetical protein
MLKQLFDWENGHCDGRGSGTKDDGGKEDTQKAPVAWREIMNRVK